MSLIEQSNPDRRLRELTSKADPFSQALQATPSQIALSGTVGMNGGMVGALSNGIARGVVVGALGGMMPSQGIALSGGLPAIGNALGPAVVSGMSGAASLSPAAISGALSAGCSAALLSSGSCH
ncbi:hypothetical protein [Paraburkholderia sp. BL6665CI2N2]|uniref:hypothetical protein n=1 Tax=Paraburkholderia sp. BL6665CI2N2 TaxID=1938806 RepID=UPI001066D3BF|nr:hypothetical protein [Paraburkholderia sp. BL6665CI2N2]